ncbi:MAG: diguanylate cyclase, partial [Gammaproteobacteria bacterium]|nr:diguanylate cyclase [Gammaproteobacteria bacterium]
MANLLRVLIVEDSEDDALLLVRQLRKGGFEIDFERVDDEGGLLSALEQKSWDIVITDHNMPQFSSDHSIKSIKNSGKDIPVIIVSGSIGEEVAVDAMKSGAHDYIMKDNLRRLVPAIERELREADNRRAHREAQHKIHYMAHHDALTGVINRYGFEERLNELLSLSEPEIQHGFLYIDLDQFKIVNDTCGHVAGDELLRQLAQLFKHHIRGNDTLARLGGDEFGILLENCSLDKAQQIADNLIAAVNQFQFSWSGKPFAIGASIGLVMIDQLYHRLSDVMSAA